MDSQTLSRFTFSEQTQTIYVEMKDPAELALPYHPFLFDLRLKIITTSKKYEPCGTQFNISPKSTTIFGRKKMGKSDQGVNESDEKRQYLLAETISKNHFSIDQKHFLTDLGSKLGTYLWIQKDNPKKLQLGDIYLIGKKIMKITLLNMQKKIVEFEFNNNVYKISDNIKTPLITIGSHSKSIIKVEGLKEYEIYINLLQMTIYNLVETDSPSIDHGLWNRLNQTQVELEEGSCFYVEPYIFKIVS